MDRYEEWITRLRASDVRALGELFEATHRPLLRYAAQLTRDEDAAYDVVQDAFIKTWNARERLDPHKSLKALLYTIVRTTSLNHIRQVTAQQSRIAAMPPSELASHDDPGERIDSDQLAERIREWISELPPKRQEVFRLSRFDGLSHDEIAQVLDLAPRTVTNHIMLALKQLRDRLQAFQAHRT